MRKVISMTVGNAGALGVGALLDEKQERFSEIESHTVFEDVQDADPEGSFFNQIVDDEVLRAIDALPEEFREALVLSDVEGMAYAEIAEVTGVSVGTVKSRLYRARQALQRNLFEYAVEMGYIKGGSR